MELTQDQLDFIFKIIRDRSGITLTKEKSYLLDSRLLPIVRKLQLKNLSELINSIYKSHDEQLITEIVDAMTTNESSFFRDTTPFEYFVNIVIPRIRQLSPEKKHLRIWSAACSTGQEPYTLAITIKEKLSSSGLEFEIIASDISDTVLEKAKEGLYTQFEVQRGLPVGLLLKYFTQEDKSWRIKEEIRKLVTFKQVNLIKDFTLSPKFDIIFCRNVLIYFDVETKVRVLNNLCKLLEPHGVIFLGSSETILGVETKLRLLDDSCAGIYIINQ